MSRIVGEDHRRKEVVMGLEIDGRFKAYPLKELKNGAHSFDDEFSGKKFVVKFDEKN